MSSKDFKHLSKSEKILLVEEIWDSIQEDTESEKLTVVQKKLIDQRLKSSKTSAKYTWNQVKAKARKRIGK